MYKIYTRKPKDTEVKTKVILNSFKYGLVPRSVFLGTGNKAQRYANYLATCFKEEGGDLLRLLAHIHLQGHKHGDLLLEGDPKMPYHAQVVKEFIENNADFLSTVVPYLFPGEKVLAEGEQEAELPEGLKAKLEGEKLTPMSSSKKTLADLPAADRDQIMALIAADQAKQEQEPPVIPITVGDLPESEAAQVSSDSN